MSKAAVVVLSDPQSGSEEALGRVFNAMAVVYDYKEANQEVKLIFQGTGTRWPEELQKADHPGHALYTSIEDKIEGISCGCAEVFRADASGLDLISTNDVPGTSGFPSYVVLQREGFQVFTF